MHATGGIGTLRNQMSSDPGTTKLVSIQDAAKYFGISDRTIRRYIASGLIAGYRVGPRLIRVDLLELQQATNRIPSAAQE